MAKGAFAFGAFPIPLVLGQKYPAGFEVLRQGAIAKDVWIIDDGVVKLVYFDEDGCEVTVGVRLKGWILGSASVILKKLGYLVDSSGPHMLWYGRGAIFRHPGRLGSAVWV
jgi:CRP-like cAMP-binding protein